MLRAPAAERNKEPILEKLKLILPPSAVKILEIASGTGQHVAHFAKAFTRVTWQPSEYDPTNFSSIQAYIDHERLTNVKSPIAVDITKAVDLWPLTAEDRSLDAIYCANMIHISPWACSVGLFKAAAVLLKPRGLLITYGPYAIDGVLVPESNINFDKQLKQQNSAWGIRDVQDLSKLAETEGLQFQQSYDMPANNKILVFKKLESKTLSMEKGS